MKNIKHLLKNEILRKIILFFNENQNCIDTAKGISLWIGCDISQTQTALNTLVKNKILLNHKTASTSAYAYTNDKNIIKEIERYVKFK